MWFFFQGVFASSLSAEIKFICNPSSPVDRLTRKEIKNIYLGNQITWSDGSEIKVGIQRTYSILEEFARDYLQKTPDQFESYWLMKVFTGEGKYPVFFKSEAKMIEYIRETKTAIGYVSPDVATDTVKVILLSDE